MHIYIYTVVRVWKRYKEKSLTGNRKKKEKRKKKSLRRKQQHLINIASLRIPN
jgi:hypothetical protein